MRVPIEDRFWQRMDKPTGDDGCWIWQGSHRGKYGSAFYQGKRMGAHQLSYILTNGPIPDGLEVCHSCDNPLCCNPSHLWIGTHFQNMHDCIQKGRFNAGKVIGTDQHSCKLDDTKVREIRVLLDAGVSQRKIARQYHVTQPLVAQIKKRQIWAWLD